MTATRGTNFRGIDMKMHEVIIIPIVKNCISIFFVFLVCMLLSNIPIPGLTPTQILQYITGRIGCVINSITTLFMLYRQFKNYKKINFTQYEKDAEFFILLGMIGQIVILGILLYHAFVGF